MSRGVPNFGVKSHKRERHKDPLAKMHKNWQIYKEGVFVCAKHRGWLGGDWSCRGLHIVQWSCMTACMPIGRGPEDNKETFVPVVHWTKLCSGRPFRFQWFLTLSCKYFGYEFVIFQLIRPLSRRNWCESKRKHSNNKIESNQKSSHGSNIQIRSTMIPELWKSESGEYPGPDHWRF